MIAAARPSAPGWLWPMFLLLSFAILAANSARGEYAPDIQPAFDKCIASGNEVFKETRIRNLEMSEWSKGENNLCMQNRPAQYNVTPNNRRFLATSDMLDNWDGMEGKIQPLDQAAGVCWQFINGLSNARSVLLKQNETLCKQTYDKITSLRNCFKDKSEAECKGKKAEISDAIRSHNIKIQSMTKAIVDYLNPLSINSDRVVKAYGNDFTKLNENQTNLRNFSLSPQLGDVSAQNGGKQTISDYLNGISTAQMNLTDTSSTTGMLVGEHILIQKGARSFLTGLHKYVTEQRNVIAQYDETLKGAPVSDSSSLSDMGKYAPLATAGAGGLSGVMGGGAAAAAPLAAAAASGAVAMSANAKTSSLSESAAAATGPAIASSASTSLGGKAASDAAPANSGVLNTNSIPLTPTNVPPAEAAKTTTGVKFNADTFIPGSGSGSSRGGAVAPGSGSSPVRVEASTGSGRAGKMGGDEDYLRNFSNNLTPLPAAKKKNDSDNEFSNILGQMTKMFNFDDPSKAPPAVDPSAETAANGDQSAPNTDFNDGFTYGSGNYEASSSPSSSGEDEANYAAAGNRSYASAQADDPKNVQFGSIGTPLFQRVHLRHHISMEKGLVILQVGRLPQ